MMKNIKRIAATFLCLILIAVCSFTVAAATTPSITLSNVKAMPGDTVTIDIKISNNPGIMAMSFCITYDSDAFEYTGYDKGFLSRYTIKDHPDKGQIAFVNDEASNKSNNGIMMSVKFRIKDDAAPGKHSITLANQNREKYGNKLHNSFSNSSLKYIVPSVTSGSITVGETCDNAGHKYDSWNILIPADCTNTGEKEHTCVRCQYTEKVEIPFNHDFEDEWTVDKAATPTEDGIMSRHCKLCSAVTDKITFTYKEVEDSQNPDDNTSSDSDSSNDDNVSSDGSSGEDNTSSENTSNDIISGENSSENNTSDNQSSENKTPSDTTVSSGNSSGTSSSNKTPIDNTVGSKNPQSVVENIKDYQDNIKPNLENNNNVSDTQSEILSSENETFLDNESVEVNTDVDILDDKTDNTKITFTTSDIVLLVMGGAISLAIIAMAIILIVRRKKAE